MAKRFNTTAQRWEYVESYGHDAGAWLEVMRDDADEAVMLTSAFDEDTYLGKGTILQRDVSQMPVHPDSDAMAQFMVDWAPWSPGGGWGGRTGLNKSTFGTQPIHMYVVDSSHPSCEYRTFGGNTTAIRTPQIEIDTYMRGEIPLPSWAVPAQNGDRGLAVYDKGTGIMREYFDVKEVAGEPGVWTGGGGYSTVRPGLQNLAEDNYALQQRRGISNVVGMHNSLGFIGIAEALNKRINHALCFTIGAAWGSTKTYPELLADLDANGGEMPSNWPSGGSRISWPARAADGKAERFIPESTWNVGADRSKTYTNPTPHLTPTHGQWGRLASDVDPMYNPETGRPYAPFTRVVIEAAKTYGLVATDTNLWTNAFNTEQGRTFKHMYGVDPWEHNGIIDKVYPDPSGLGLGGASVGDFPWGRTEWAVMDWGRPSPDMNLRPGQLLPWRRP